MNEITCIELSPTKAIDSIDLPPQLDEAEKAVIGDCLLQLDQAHLIALSVVADDFYNLNRRTHFTALAERIFKGQALDPLELVTSGVMNQSEYAQYVDATPKVSNWRIHAELLREAHQRRRLLQLASDIRNCALSGKVESDKIVHASWRALSMISRLSIQECCDPEAMLQRYAKDMRQWDHLPLLRTGIPDLDMAMGGGVLPRGVLSLVGGEGSMKTSLALKAVETYITTVKRPVLFLSMDMEGYRVALRRLLPIMEMKELTVVEAIKNNDPEYHSALEKRQSIDNGLFQIIDGPRSLSDVQRLLEIHRPGLVVWDYLTAVTGFEREYEAMSAACQSIRQWKRRYDASWLILNQMSQAAKAGQRQGDFAGQTAGGAAIKRESDVMIELYKDTGEPEESGEERLYSVGTVSNLVATIAKSRYGEDGSSWILDYRGHTMWFTGQAQRAVRSKAKKTMFKARASW